MKNEATDAVLEAPAGGLSGRVAELSRRQVPQKFDNVITGSVLGFSEAHLPVVDFPANPDSKPLLARSIVPLQKDVIGREVVLMFENGDFRKPIVMGVIQTPEMAKQDNGDSHSPSVQKMVETEIDGESLVFTARREITLRCGKASITLTRAGKVLIRGAYLLSRSSGANQIKGASIQLN